MTMPATESVTHPKPEVVGRAFVEQYYKVFHHSPEIVHKFYLDSSVLSRPDSNGVMTSVTTLDEIDKLVLSLDSRNYFVELETVDSQTSYKDGVFILVTGCLKGTSDGIRRKFSQSFFLAHQDKGAYFVLNDVFRYVDESQPRETEQVLVNGSNSYSLVPPPTSEQEPASLEKHDVEEPSIPPPSEVVVENGDEAPNPTENGGSAVEVEIVMDQQALPNGNGAQNAPEPTASVPRDQVPMKSYASIVKFTKGSTPIVSDFVSPAKDRPSAVTEKPYVISTKANIPSKPTAPPTETPSASSNNVVESDNPHDGWYPVEGHSIYIKNLPLNATAAQVEEVFSKFGTIRPGGVQVRNHKIDRFCFGFVEFELLASMQAAIEASPVMISGRPVFVEEKKTTTRVINGVVSIGSGTGGSSATGGNARGRYPSARGGFRNDNFRGRGGFGNNQSIGRGDFRSRSDYAGRGQYANRGRGQAGRNGETYQQRVPNGNGQVDRPIGISQSAPA
ncbi:putative Ras GTPase-activating protein-binding protein [Dioscorea sansibarensis]